MGLLAKDTADLASQVRSTFHLSREALRRAHERAQEASERARRMRSEMRHTRDACAPHESTPAVLRVVEEESARAVRENQRFLAVVAHELRQPLNAAVGAMSLLEADASSAATSRARIVLRRQLLHMSTLLDDLLDMSRLTLKTLRLQPAPLDLHRVVEDACEDVQSAAARSGLSICADLPESEVPMLGDAGRLHQAFANLLGNAVRYTPSGGRVSVSLTLAGDTAMITVADTGQGIAPSELTNIFEPFWRGREGHSDGFGIGLALVRGIVELHGGSIVALSEGPGTGAQFCVTLPLSRTD